MEEASEASVAEDAGHTKSSITFPVVGLGASAGGIEAMLRFFREQPAKAGMAFVVVLHLSPKHTSNLDKVLGGATTMVVTQVTRPTPIEANHVYVIPPNQSLSMNDGYLRLSDYDPPTARHASIDMFFRTLAAVHRERAVAIVLSGTGADGAVGIARIKELGGVTMVQVPEDAEFADMPRAALATGMIDWSLPAVEMPQKLMEVWENARRIQLPESGDGPVTLELEIGVDRRRKAEDALQEIMTTLRLRTGHDFRHYKRATVLRRLERRLQVNRLPDLPAYRDHLHRDFDEARALLKDLLIGVTNFFRDREAFEALERDVLPAIFRPERAAEQVRTWVAGCSTGEEAYSTAMLLHEAADGGAATYDLQVFATDIDEAAIAKARSGSYPEAIVTDVPPTRLRRFFDHEGAHYVVRKPVRESVLFAVHNVLRDPPFSRLDLVCCRNLLIYLDRDVQAEVLAMFHFALRPGGHLFLGSSESVDVVSNLFTPVDKKNRIYRATAEARASRGLPPLPLAGTPPISTSVERHIERRRVPYAELHQQLLEQYAPPSVLVDSDSNIVHLSDQAGRFLRHAAGSPSHNLLEVVQPELRLELRIALFQAAQSGKSVEARRVEIHRESRQAFVNMIVRPVPGKTQAGAMTLVLFDEVEDSLAEEPSAPEGREGDPLIAHLEEEVRRSKDQLQVTIEQSETSTEELKASNEELQAINEELRSTTEELETSKEELQSINEELTTVNFELKTKVDETAKINDDLQNLIASTDIATVFIDRGLVIKRFTPRAMQIFNLLQGDIGRSLLDITHKLNYDSLGVDCDGVLQTLTPVEREVRALNGRWYLTRVLPYRTAEDRIDGAVLTFVDITQRRFDAERMRLVAESMRDFAIITMDPRGAIVSWSPGAERIFGYAEREAIGQPFSLIFTPEDRALGRAERELREALDAGRSEDDRWHRHKDGSRRYISGVTTPMFDGVELHGFAKIGRDLTNFKGVEAARDAEFREQAVDRMEAQSAVQLKDEFLAVMSHELKNPLNLIHLNAEVLAMLPEAQALPAVSRAAATIRKAVASQTQIIDDLLDLSRVNTGKLSLNREPVDWCLTVEKIVGALQAEAKTREVGLGFEPQGVAGPMVDADPVRVEQIVWNVLSNALRFTPAGGRVIVRLRKEALDGVMEVEDTGRGIEAVALPAIFDMFHQARVARDRHERGLGIGLALVKHLAEAHGGRVEARSEGLGKGSVFTVRLPLLTAEAPREPGETTTADGVVGLRALLIDDEPDNTESMGALLTMNGLEVAIAHSGKAALAEMGRQTFDLVLSDIGMPEMDGYALVRALREDPAFERIPVVALTGFGRDVDARRALAAGFDAHLSKPVSFDRLLAVLMPLLKRRTAGSEKT